MCECRDCLCLCGRFPGGNLGTELASETEAGGFEGCRQVLIREDTESDLDFSQQDLDMMLRVHRRNGVEDFAHDWKAKDHTLQLMMLNPEWAEG